MRIDQFSDQFDVLLQSYINQNPIGKDNTASNIALDEYEKSLFLTKAQDELVLSLYTGNNPFGDSYEETEELRRYLADLVEDEILKPITNHQGQPISTNTLNEHAFFTLPYNLWFITYESVNVNKGEKKCGGEASIDVVPVRHDEYQKIKRNPFRGVNDRRALRLDLSDGVVEIVCKYPITNYYIRYIRETTPIILVDLPCGMSIKECNHVTECHLHTALHQKILDVAVRMALQSKGLLKEDNKNNK